MKNYLFIFISVIFYTTSCKKDLPNVTSDFYGRWHCQTGSSSASIVNLYIDTNGYGNYSEPHAHFDGQATSNSTILKIGKHKFKILEKPHIVDSNFSNGKLYRWAMKLNSPSFYQGGGTYYKDQY